MDPFSIAVGVAGLISTAGKACKSFYQFFRSIHDAPAAVRDLATALLTLNVALGQVQESLLNPRFVGSSDDEQVASLEACLISCTAILDEVELKVERSGLAEDQIGLAKKAWESIKWSFNEDEINTYLRRVEAEKTTLLLTVDNIRSVRDNSNLVFSILIIFSRRLSANILGQVAETKALVQKQDRRLKDIHVFCQWVVGQQRKGDQRSPSGAQRIETSAFAASSAYDEGDIARLLQSSGSVLSLTLGEPVDETLGAVWTPDPVSRVPLRRSITTATPGSPRPDSQGNYIHTDRTIAKSASGPIRSHGILRAIATANDYMAMRPKKLSGLRSRNAASNTLAWLGPASIPIFELLRKASDISKDMVEDLEFFQVTYAIIEKYTADDNNDEVLRVRLAASSQAIADYLTFAAKILIPEPGRSRALQDIRMIIKADPNENERKRLRDVVLRQYDAFKQAHAFNVANQTLALQNEQLKLQRQVAANMRTVLERTNLSPAAQASVDPGMLGIVQADVDPDNI